MKWRQKALRNEMQSQPHLTPRSMRRTGPTNEPAPHGLPPDPPDDRSGGFVLSGAVPVTGTMHAVASCRLKCSLSLILTMIVLLIRTDGMCRRVLWADASRLVVC